VTYRAKQAQTMLKSLSEISSNRTALLGRTFFSREKSELPVLNQILSKVIELQIIFVQVLQEINDGALDKRSERKKSNAFT
jgi:hypothetical protein